MSAGVSISNCLYIDSQQDEEKVRDTTVKTVKIKVAKGLSKDEAYAEIRSQFEGINKNEPINLKIYSIQNDPRWIEYLNDLVDRVRNLYFVPYRIKYRT